jgi:hypothetical protein
MKSSLPTTDAAVRTPIHPLWGMLEIAGFTGYYLFTLWFLGPQVATGQMSILAYWMLVLAGWVYLFWFSTFILHRDPPEWRGWGARGLDGTRPGSFQNSWRTYAGFTAGGAVALIGYAGWLDPDRLAHIPWKEVGLKFAGYLGSGLLQAAIFFGYMLNRIRAMIPVSAGRHSVSQHQFCVAVATASLFSFYHLPNVPLMGLTWAAGFGWAWIYYRRPNIPSLVLSHACLGTVLHRVVQLYMRVGPAYAHPDLHIVRTLIPGLQKITGNLF